MYDFLQGNCLLIDCSGLMCRDQLLHYFSVLTRVVIFICASLSAKITARVLGVWKSSLPRSGKEREAAFLMHNARKKFSVGAEAVVLVMRMGAYQRLVRVSAWGSQILTYVLGLVLQGAVYGGMKVLKWLLASW